MTQSETRGIQVLPEHIANQIAAGEVVQRPESIVKELVENSLDAGAERIALVVRGAGKELLHLLDNGRGMTEADLQLAPKRHATSKILTSEDLHRIYTFGFRGEALSSICAVAHVEIRTRQHNTTTGWKLVSEPLREVHIEPCMMDAGTQVFVRNLFYNVPGRRKFLRSDLTEFRHIADTMLKFALAFPDKRFVFYDAESLMYDLAPTSLLERIRDTLGEQFAQTLLPVNFSTELRDSPIRVTGYIGQPNFAKKTKTHQYLYLNSRSITSKQLYHAIIAGYEHFLDQAHHPAIILNLELDAERVDVNVHPQKHEVKFEDERSIYNAVRQAVKNTLHSANLVPRAEFFSTSDLGLESFRLSSRHQTHQSPATEVDPSLRGHEIQVSSRSYLQTQYPSAHPEDRRITPQHSPEFVSLFDRSAVERKFGIAAGDSPNNQQQTSGVYAPPPLHHRLLWQAHKKYIFLQTADGIVVIDQHAAHERILYERALKAMNEGFRYAQELLFPVEVHLTPSEYTLVQELQSELTLLGFQCILSGQNLEIVSVPADVQHGQEELTLKELLEQYREYQEVQHTETRDNLAASFACRSAIRTGAQLSPQEIQQLVDDLYATQMPFVCPHGRPTIIEFPLEEFDRRFGRSS